MRASALTSAWRGQELLEKRLEAAQLSGSQEVQAVTATLKNLHAEELRVLRDIVVAKELEATNHNGELDRLNEVVRALKDEKKQAVARVEAEKKEAVEKLEEASRKHKAEIERQHNTQVSRLREAVQLLRCNPLLLACPGLPRLVFARYHLRIRVLSTRASVLKVVRGAGAGGGGGAGWAARRAHQPAAKLRQAAAGAGHPARQSAAAAGGDRQPRRGGRAAGGSDRAAARASRAPRGLRAVPRMSMCKRTISSDGSDADEDG